MIKVTQVIPGLRDQQGHKDLPDKTVQTEQLVHKGLPGKMALMGQSDQQDHKGLQDKTALMELPDLKD